MVGLTVAMHFQQFEDHNFFFSSGVCPRIPLDLLQSVQRDFPDPESRLDFSWDTNISIFF